MANRKRRKENLDKRLEKIREELKKERDKQVESTIQEKYHVIESKIKTKSTSQQCQDGDEHDWKIHHESEDHTEIEYYCDNCHMHKKEKQTFEHFKPKLLPYQMKSHGPATRHHDPTKYSAPETSVHLIGDIIQKSEIFNRCKNNLKIKSNATSLEEKAKILSDFIPPIILDECIVSQKMLEKIQEIGYDVCFLKRGLPDEDISEIASKINGVLVTEDKLFHKDEYLDEFSKNVVFIPNNSELLMQNVEIIAKAMRKFES